MEAACEFWCSILSVKNKVILSLSYIAFFPHENGLSFLEISKLRFYQPFVL